MTHLLNYILWDISPEIPLFGDFAIRWYGLLFAAGFLVGQQIMHYIYRKEGKSEKDLDALLMYMIVGIVLGARLGHCLFYEPNYFLKHPLEILMVWKGGLASHGATVGVIVAIWLYAKKYKMPYFYLADRLLITVAIGGCFIRLGNLMNSEIIGKPTDASWAFVFAHSREEVLTETYPEYINQTNVASLQKDTVVNGTTYTLLQLNIHFNTRKTDEKIARNFTENILPQLFSRGEVAKHFAFLKNDIDYQLTTQKGELISQVQVWGIPRHPAPIYESLATIFTAFLLFAIWWKYKENTPYGVSTGLFLTIIFGLRFVWEFMKENQVDFEENLILNMGQILSIPVILFGVILLARVAMGKKNGG